MNYVVGLYQDSGAGEFTSKCLLDTLSTRGKIRSLDAKAVIEGRGFNDLDVFIMPGGADLPYCAALNGAGNRRIREYVENGGLYLGICAGAYYGCSDIAFLKDTALEISGPRELAFGDVTAYGPLPEIAKGYDLTLDTAAVTRFSDVSGHVHGAYYHGGPAFTIRDDSTVDILARYDEIPGRPPAIISLKVGMGRAILCGLHLEVTADHLYHYPASSSSEQRRAHELAQMLTSGSSAANWLINLIDVVRTPPFKKLSA